MNIFQYIRDISLLLVAALVVTIVACAAKFNAMINGSGVYFVTLSIAVLIIYGVISYKIPAFASKSGFDPAVKNGSLFGCITGLIWIAHLTIEHLMSSWGNSKPALSMGMLILIFAFYWIAAFRTVIRTGKISASMFAAVWSAMTGTLILFIFGFVLFLSKHDLIEANLQHSFKESGMNDLTSFVILNIIQSGTTHLIAAPVVSVIFGATAVLIVQISLKLRK